MKTKQATNIDKQIVTTVQNTELQGYGEYAVVMELTSRIMDFHPAIRQIKEELGEEFALQVGQDAAQKAVLMGASPLQGTNEIHIWHEMKNKNVAKWVNGRKQDNWIQYPVYHCELGKNYWERRGRQVAGGIQWIDKTPRLMNESEYAEFGIDKKTHIGAIAKGYRMDDLEHRLGLVQAGMMTPQEAKDGIVQKGIGVVKRGDQPANGRPLSWKALKRARTDFYWNAVPVIPGERLDPGEGLKRAADGSIQLDHGRINLESREVFSPRKKHSEEQLAQFARDLFDDPNDVDYVEEIDESDEVLEGEFAFEPDEPDFDLDEIDESDEVEQVDELSEEETYFKSLQDQDERIALIDYDTWEEIHTISASKWMEYAISKIARYPDSYGISGAAKKLGYKTIPGKNTKEAKAKRANIFLDVNYYAEMREKGVDGDEILARIDTMIPF